VIDEISLNKIEEGHSDLSETTNEDNEKSSRQLKDAEFYSRIQSLLDIEHSKNETQNARMSRA